MAGWPFFLERQKSLSLGFLEKTPFLFTRAVERGTSMSVCHPPVRPVPEAP